MIILPLGVNSGQKNPVRCSFPWLFILLSTLSSFAQGTAFMYQGALADSGHPANGSYDLTFTLYDSPNQPGNIVGATITNSGTGITNGLFSTILDFGGVFDGTRRWLQIGVRTNGAANFVTLSARQPVAAVPYAIVAGSASNLVGALSTANLAPVASLVAGASNGLYSAMESSWDTNLATTNATLINPTLINPTMTASGNVYARAVFTNDPYFFGGGLGLGFYGVGFGNTNDSGIQWTGAGGFYGFIDMIPNHDGNPSAPGRAELRIESANRIALIPNTLNYGDDASIEVGLANGTKMYFNTMSNASFPPFASGSGALVFRNVAISNGAAEEFDPEIIGMWGTGSVTGGPNQFGSHLLLCPDAGYGGYGGGLPPGPPDVNKAIVGIDLAVGTNVAGTFYTSTELFGRSGTTTNSLRVDTNGITTVGLVSMTQYYGPTNIAPVFTASSSGLHTIALGSGWTNDFGQRADMVVDCFFSAGSSAFCGFFFTNWVTGECYTNGLTMSGANTEQRQIIFPDISPGDHGGLTNLTSGGSILTIVKGRWKLK